MEIGELARAAAGSGWSRLTVRRAEVGAHAVTTVSRDGREITVDGMNEPFQRLRELAYQADAGTWFTCELAFAAGSRGYTGRVDSTEPPFGDVPARAALAELTLFPRAQPPGWLLSALPTAPPLGLPTTYGDHYDRWDRRPDDHRPRPPLTGELAYLPAASMTARAFSLRQKSDRHLMYLAERAEDKHAGIFAVMSHQGGYRVARAGGGDTHEGVRSITLDGATLRLELTPKAADTLETETTFAIHLDLPPETTGELRAALPGMLRPVTQAPELIGF